MKHENFNMKEHGFVGHLAEPDNGSDCAVIGIMYKTFGKYRKEDTEYFCTSGEGDH